MTPDLIKQYLNTTINEYFGSVQELESRIGEDDLQYIYNYPSEIILLKIWEFSVDLTSLGKVNNAEYYILDKHLNLVKTVYSSNNIIDDDDTFNYAINLPHGSYFHIAFRYNNSLKIVLVWLAKELPYLYKQNAVKEWASRKSVYQQSFYRTGEITVVNPYDGWLQVYYVQGEVHDNITSEHILGNPNSVLVASTEQSRINFNIALNGWYGFFLLQDNKIKLLTLSNVSGFGSHKLIYNNGLVFINLIGSLDSHLEGLDRINSGLLNIEASLTYALSETQIDYTLYYPNKEAILSPTVTSYNAVYKSTNILVNTKEVDFEFSTLNVSTMTKNVIHTLEGKTSSNNASVNNVIIINGSLTNQLRGKQLDLL